VTGTTCFSITKTLHFSLWLYLGIFLIIRIAYCNRLPG
jgi:hypothetical protein